MGGAGSGFCLLRENVLTQISGNANSSTLAEVGANTKALYVVPRPNDYGALGMYSLGAASGTMAAGLSANSPVFSARYTGSNLVLLRKVLFTAGNTATAFTAGICTFQCFNARSFSGSDTGGTSVLPSTGGNKKRTANMGSTGFGDIRISSTATLSAGTRTLDAQAFSSISVSIPATAGTTIYNGSMALFEARAGEYPEVFANNEGFIIQATVPATGTWTFSVIMDWEEVTTANWY
jgi:hypothetical protein